MPVTIAVDWSHTKELATYDGKKSRTEDRKALLKRIAERESIERLTKSNTITHCSIVLEQGCPLSLTYDLLKAGARVHYISNRATQDYRTEHGIEKTDENDARIIWELSQNGAKLTEATLDDAGLRMHDLYGKYRRYQKARVAMMNMKKGHERQYGDGREGELDGGARIRLQPLLPPIEGDGESTETISSMCGFQPSPYDVGIKALGEAEKACLKELEELAGSASTPWVDSSYNLQPPVIRGLGPRIWIGILVTLPTLRTSSACPLISASVDSPQMPSRVANITDTLGCSITCWPSVR